MDLRWSFQRRLLIPLPFAKCCWYGGFTQPTYFLSTPFKMSWFSMVRSIFLLWLDIIFCRTFFSNTYLASKVAILIIFLNAEDGFATAITSLNMLTNRAHFSSHLCCKVSQRGLNWEHFGVLFICQTLFWVTFRKVRVSIKSKLGPKISLTFKNCFINNPRRVDLIQWSPGSKNE